MRYTFFLLFLLIFFSGCANSIQNFSKSTNFQGSLNRTKTRNEYLQLFKKYQEENMTQDLLWNYEAGSVGYLSGSYKGSIFYFDEAEKLIKRYDEEFLSWKILANLGTTLTNDNFLNYRPKSI